MAKVDVWSTVHAERKALAADLGGLTEAQWSTRSLCTEWTVRDVVAHLAATAKIGPPQFFGKLLASGFSLKRLQTKDVAALRGGSPAETLDNFRGQVESSKHPPGPSDTWLGEVIVHAEDVRRPLGLEHSYPMDAVVQVADFYKGSNLVIGTKKRIAGVKLRATDTEWTHGEGPEAAGPMLALLLAMTGRGAALDQLSGDGVAKLRSAG